MKAPTQVTPEQEPVGIVISRGSRAELPSVFRAYVWAPAPEPGGDAVHAEADAA